eukprot:TRINITY_DN592_c0_g1_i1.p1 TRINITY_DN592_c0_g1~~TRINITY_DN592_c0_g1_i1.p1  ORF type:complete len:315 (+),score=78.10 TRINITY_DN592_c0_g1_i1:117-1061(+)
MRNHQNSNKEMPTEEFRTITYDNGDKYEGETLKSNHSVRHGRGRYQYASGNAYEGDWQEGKRQGQGEFSWNSGGRYVGTFKDGKHEGGFYLTSSSLALSNLLPSFVLYHSGYGTYYYDNGDIYDGEWSGGNFEGRGTFKWKDDTWYEGEWKGDYMNGYGVAQWVNGNRFEGNWRGDGSFGYGVHTTPMNDVWEGEWYFKAHKEGAWQGECDIVNRRTKERYSGHICRQKGLLIFGHLPESEKTSTTTESNGEVQDNEDSTTATTAEEEPAEIMEAQNVVSSTAAENTVECPICGGAFPLESIEEHANQCIESLG